jgi:hypothetical protein
VRLDEDLLLGFLLLKDRLNFLDLGIKGIKELIATLDLDFFLLKDTVLLFKILFKPL